MNKTELIAAVAEKTGLAKKDAEAAVKAFTETVSAELVAGNKVQIVGFGTFEVSERAERQGRNPRTGESMKIAAAKAPKFKPGKTLKTAVNVPKKKTRKTRSVPGAVLNMQSIRICLTKMLFKFSALQSTRVEKGKE